MIAFVINKAAKSLLRLLSDRSLDQAFDRLPKFTLPAKEDKATSENIQTVRVCALQSEIKIHADLRSLITAIDAQLSAAVGQGAALVCFPEFYGLTLCGLSKEVRLMLSLLGEREKKQNVSKEKSTAHNSGGSNVDLPKLISGLGFLQERYAALMARFARRYGVYVSCGTIISVENGKLYNRHILIGPDGRLLGQADKLHLTKEEHLLGLSQGEQLSVVTTEIGNIALLVCMDATYFESFRIAKRLGADYAIVPIGDMAAFDPWLALRGVQVRANETGLAIIKPALVSAPGFPIRFTGRAGIWFPLESAFSSVEAVSWDTQGFVTADLDLAALRDFSNHGAHAEPGAHTEHAAKERLFNRSNPDFDENYAEAITQSTIIGQLSGV